MRLSNPSMKVLAALVVSLGLSVEAMAQAKQPAPAKPAAPAKTQAPTKSAAPAKQPVKAQQAKKAVKKAEKKAAPAAKPAEARAGAHAGRRDPFLPLVDRSRPGQGSVPENLPAGKAGLMVSTMRLDGLVRAPNGMIAVVSSPQQRVYFLREGDRIYDGRVEKMDMSSITLRENSKDAFGKPLERVVTKRLYPSAGEQ